jgi:hypothetical protein
MSSKDESIRRIFSSKENSLRIVYDSQEFILICLFSMQFSLLLLQRNILSAIDIEGSMYTHSGLPYPEGALPDPSVYSATSLASASLLYSSWFAQTKPGQLFGLQGKQLE